MSIIEQEHMVFENSDLVQRMLPEYQISLKV